MNVVPLRQLDHVERFLRTFTSKNTRAAYARDLREYAAFSGTMDPLSFSTLAQYRDALITSSAPATVSRKFAAVKSFLAFLASEGAIPTNPAQNLKVPKSRTIEHTEAFEDSEVIQVIRATDVNTLHGSWHRLALVLLFNLGLRRSELANLKVSSFAEHRGKRFVSIIGKGDNQRLLLLTELVASEVDAYMARFAEHTGRRLQSQDFLFPGANNQPVNPSTIYRCVIQYAKQAGVTKRVSPHSCRATLISHLLEQEVSPRSVADLAGHASIQTTVGIYDKKRDALTNSAASKVSYR